jgi:hypothetical protein
MLERIREFMRGTATGWWKPTAGTPDYDLGASVTGCHGPMPSLARRGFADCFPDMHRMVWTAGEAEYGAIPPIESACGALYRAV